MSTTSLANSTVHYLHRDLERASLPKTSTDPATCHGDVIDIDIGVEPLREAEQLENLWTNLEARAAHSFYLSWLWIGTWLRHLPKGADPHLVVARTAGRVVGLAIVCRRRAWHLGLRRRMRWLLHETGDTGYDRLFVEHNGILVENSVTDTAISACLDALTRRLCASDELILSGVGPDIELAIRRAARSAGLALDVKLADTAPWVDFAEVRRKGGDYRAALGRNTRQAVGRAVRLYAERGAIEHRIMKTATEAIAAIDELIGFHWSRWGRKGPFANPGFRSFHEDLIMRGVPAGVVRISRTVVADQTIGVLYNFVHRNHVLNYQSGFLYEQDARLKPGLVSHVLSIEDSLLRGEHGYDFLAGPAGHKSRLANAEQPMMWIALGRDSLERRIEAGVRRTRRKLRVMVTR
jgi:CelD/BcsL family acetyltransferase involved in cellulose biosynthesis